MEFTIQINKRIKEVLYPDLEKCLMMWYFQTIVILPIISDTSMIEKAQEFGIQTKRMCICR